MALKHVHHVIARPGRKDGDSDVSIKVAMNLLQYLGFPRKKLMLTFTVETIH